MHLIPFGEVKEDRVELSKRYNLIEQIGGIWRLTDKCKRNYTELSYLKYLKGKVEIPQKTGEDTKEAVVQAILNM